MARTLPWLKEPTSKSTSKPTSSRPPKRQRLLDPNSDSDAPPLPTPRKASPSHPTAPPFSPRHARPPSSSPPQTNSSPPPPPPSTTLMRPGLSADDIYIMVEDEFLSTARLYTAHLHRAEYQRLKLLSRSRPPIASALDRPVDSITEMRAETKKKKEAEKQAGRVQRMFGGWEQARKVRGGDEESGLEEDGERGDEVGVGTVLKSLMKKSSRENMRSLTGLHGVRSSTRAAAGFERAESGRGKEEKESIMKESGKPVRKGEDVEVQSEEETEEGDSDDLDAPTVRKAAKRMEPTKTHVDPTGSVKPVQRSGLKNSRAAGPPSSPPERQRSPSPSPLRRSKKAVLERLRARREQARKEKEKGLAIDEIPVFLV